MTFEPVTCFLCYRNNTLSFSFANFRDAIFWSGKMEKVEAMETTSSSPPMFLCLKESGRQLKEVVVGNKRSPEEMAKSSHNIDLPFEMDRIWASPLGGPNCLLLLSTVHSGIKTESGLDLDRHHLFITKPGHIAFDEMSSPKFTFIHDENIVEVCWQTYPSSYFTPKTEDVDFKRHQYWVDGDGPMLGVLTSRRVLLLSSSLSPLKCTWYRRYTCDDNSALNAHVISICWAGSSLLFTTEAGEVNYMVADKSAQNHTQRKPFIADMHSSFFVDNENVLSGERLCTFPSAHSCGGQVRLSMCLPDRLVYMTREIVGGISIPSLIIRPCLPVEPLLCGLLRPPSLMRQQEDVENLSSLIKSLLTFYIPGKPVIGASTEGGALPMTQSTRRLCYILCQSGFEDLAMVAAGICVNDRDLAGADFLHNRWISPGVKFHVALRSGEFSRACNDLLAAKPELQELFLDPESFGGGMLPHSRSALARQFAAAAYILAMLGQRDLARKLADLAGDDELLAMIVQADDMKRGGEKGTKIQRLKSLQEGIRGKNAALYQILKCVTLEDENDRSGNESLEWNLQVSSIGEANRRTSMQSFSSPFGCYSLEQSGKVSLDLSSFDRAQRGHATQRGGGLGPPTKLGLLAMDSVEDWLGKSLPEVVAPGGSDSNRLHGVDIGRQANDDDFDEYAYPGGLQRPESWVDGIGTGKEWDKVVGYWRFSDVVKPGEPNFLSSGKPKSRLNFVDLSTYHTPLEVFADGKNRMKFEPTLSAVDPGEDHLKVKELNDVVFSLDLLDANKCVATCGMRLNVGRGSALDVGMYHVDQNRQNLTIEIDILRLESANNDASEKHALLKRVGGPNLDQEIWGLYVDNKGKLLWQMGNDDTNLVETGENEINMGPTEEMPVSLWSHVAAVISSTDSSSSVSLYINGDRLAKGQLILPPLDEEFLKATNIFVAPNLRGWRLTELRIWADSRSAIDIDSMKENYLPLASKRKRMQFRIKGSKQLFGPAPSSLALGEPSESTSDNESPQLEKVHLVTRDVSSRKGFGLAAPGGKGVGKLSGPGGALNGPRGNISRGGSRRGAVVQASQGTEDEKVGGETEQDKMSASFRRLSALAGPSTNALSGNGKEIDDGSQKVVRSSSPKPKEKDISTTHLSPAQKRLRARQVAGSQSASHTTGGDCAPNEKAKETKLSPETHSPPPVLSSDSTKHNGDLTVKSTFNTGMLWSCSLKKVTGCSALDACRCIRRRPLNGSCAITAPCVTRSSSDSNDRSKIVFLQLAVELQAFSGAVKHTPYILDELDISADSVVVSPRKSSVSTGETIVAYYNQKKLTLLNHTTGARIVEMPMTAPLIFWMFSSETELFLVTSTALFLWNIKPEVASTSRPVKLCNRADILDPARRVIPLL